MPTENEVIVKADDLKVHFGSSARAFLGQQEIVRAVDGVSLSIERGTVLGLVGESGCGKSTLAKALIALRQPTSGTVEVHGKDLAKIGGKELRALRQRMQIVFQDPYGSLNPRMQIGTAIAEPILAHGLRKGKEVDQRVGELLELVGLRANMSDRYPHEFSGGQRQRIAIARALAVEPDIIVCDEPISALDVSIQAQILNLFMELRESLSLTYVFVAHDLAAVRRVSSSVAVMYLGRIVEYGSRDEVYDSPHHPYTVSLLAAVPDPGDYDPTRRERYLLSGDLPPVSDEIQGCAFKDRCWLYRELGEPSECSTQDPVIAANLEQHVAACHFSDEVGTRTSVSEEVQ